MCPLRGQRNDSQGSWEQTRLCQLVFLHEFLLFLSVSQ